MSRAKSHAQQDSGQPMNATTTWECFQFSFWILKDTIYDSLRLTHGPLFSVNSASLSHTIRLVGVCSSLHFTHLSAEMACTLWSAFYPRLHSLDDNTNKYEHLLYFLSPLYYNTVKIYCPSTFGHGTLTSNADICHVHMSRIHVLSITSFLQSVFLITNWWSCFSWSMITWTGYDVKWAAKYSFVSCC